MNGLEVKGYLEAVNRRTRPTYVIGVALHEEVAFVAAQPQPRYPLFARFAYTLHFTSSLTKGLQSIS